jgi:RNA polymerase sigma factor (sigma-70 family)
MTNYEFNACFLKMMPKLNMFAMSLTHDRNSAPDLVQETFLKASVAKNNNINFTNLKAWVYTIMKNTFINNYRRNVRENLLIDYSQDLYFINQPLDRGYISPESRYSEQEIENLIDSLTSDFRIPFRMAFDGYKYQEISDELGLKIGTVKSRIFLSRQKLMQMLKDYEG